MQLDLRRIAMVRVHARTVLVASNVQLFGKYQRELPNANPAIVLFDAKVPVYSRGIVARIMPRGWI